VQLAAFQEGLSSMGLVQLYVSMHACLFQFLPIDSMSPWNISDWRVNKVSGCISRGRRFARGEVLLSESASATCASCLGCA
jgi:hypothetical protein